MRKRIQQAARYKLGAAAAAAAAVAVVAVAVAAQAAVPMAAQAATGEPATVAVSQIENLNNTVRGATGTYGGLWIDDKTNTVYVSTTKAGISAATVAAMEPRAAAAAAPSMKLVVVPAKYDFAQLQAFAARVKNDQRLQKAAKASHALLSEWYPDPLTDKLVIGFTKVTAAERAAVSAQFGTTARVISAPIFYSTVGKPGQAATSPRTIRPNSRSADTNPWYGGDQIHGPDGYCTSGFDWSGNSMTTAGHCGNATFTNNGQEVGKTSTIQWGNNRIDMQRLTGSTYMPYIWAGSGGNTPEPVSGSGGVAIGGKYCTGGAVTVQNCTAVVSKIDMCASIGTTNQPVTYVCYLDQASSSNSTTIAQPGDSGGPVYTSNSASAPYATGTICAEGNGGLSALWSDMYEAKVIFGGAPEVGT
jgi:hypothetical protein